MFVIITKIRTVKSQYFYLRNVRFQCTRKQQKLRLLYRKEIYFRYYNMKTKSHQTRINWISLSLMSKLHECFMYSTDVETL